MRLIDADALALRIGNFCQDCGCRQDDECHGCYVDDVYLFVKEAPTIEAEPVKHGRWINLANGNCDDLYTCSECKETWLGIGGYNYCPHCGAKMNGERRESE